MALKSRNPVVRLPETGSAMYSFNESMLEATVVDRPNRFIVNIDTGKERIRCHLHDPGRLEELIYPGNRVLYRPTNGQKTSHSITAAWHKGEWILTDTRVHSAIASGFLPPTAKREVPVGNHRIDFMSEDTLIEVKGCTLLDGKTATFPDAPTIRGRQHLQLLREHAENGGRSLLIVLVFRRSAECFIPNRNTDPDFYRTFFQAYSTGLDIFIPKFSFEEGSIVYQGAIELCNTGEK